MQSWAEYLVGKNVSNVRTETAANLAVARVPMFSAILSAAGARALLHEMPFDSVDAVLVLNDEGHYAGTARLQDVLNAPDETSLSSLVRKDWPVVGPDIDQEQPQPLPINTVSRQSRWWRPMVARSGSSQRLRCSRPWRRSTMRICIGWLES